MTKHCMTQWHTIYLSCGSLRMTRGIVRYNIERPIDHTDISV